MHNTTILIVDDEPDNFDVIEALLEHQEYQLHYAPNGQAAINALPILNPGLILLDVMMPELDGIEVCRRIKSMARWSNIPIMMVTALDSKKDLAQCLDAGADDFISKPVNALELRARVQSLLRIKAQYDQIQEFSQVQEQTIQLLKKTLHELRGNLARSLSHELNTPLNGILGTLDLLRYDLANMEPSEIEELLGWIHESACRLEHLTNKFLVYLELELASTYQKPLSLDDSGFNLALLRGHIQDRVRRADRTADLTLVCPEQDISFSERYFMILLTELVDNACKFSEHGQPIQITIDPQPDAVTLTVQDAGRGMTPEQLQRIDALVQFDRQHYEQQGVGLGLRIIQKIAELGNAPLRITSDLHKGTQIQITFPTLAAESVAIP
ncbi:hybrid sensor histidine kinase/response regulator [Spirulina major]|uniref:hybrid sensor histidine kinase/response regulator n=1 Tax=Spirulina major TaxID=270636 RepID=UPI0009339E09|nr:hybrid sensor histidine kinase/response regulator [Spirulina major]